MDRSMPRLSRRLLLSGMAASAVTTLLAACGGTAAPTVPAASTGPSTATIAGGAVAPTAAGTARPSAPPAANAAGSASTATRAASAVASPGAGGGAAAIVAPPVTPRTAAPRGELRYATGIHFPTALDATKAGYNMIFFGAGETLTRLTPENKLEPWLAESVAVVNATTWRVKLRPNVRFWDGGVVDATAVAAAFRTNWETQGSATSLIDKATTITVVDPTTLDFVLPRPAGNFPNALAAQFFVIHKDAGKVMSGPYRPTRFEADKEMVSEAFADHWGGPPPIAKLTIRNVPDPNTRALALQSGEIDMISNVLPETLSTFGPDITASAIPSTRVHMTLLNATRGIFADRQVREATAHAVDRAALLQVALGGQGAPQATVFPILSGFDQVSLQAYDRARARQLLDAAGWAPGADGIRAKGGQKLAFTLLSYPGRPELTQMAVAMQAQLKAVGYEMQVREVQQIEPELKKAEYDASMYSVNSLNTGDPYYFYSLLFPKEGAYNYAKYELPGAEALLAELRDAPDPARRQALSRQIQELVRANVPTLFLVSAPTIVAYKKDKLRDFTLHPHDLYFVNTTMRVG